MNSIIQGENVCLLENVLVAKHTELLTKKSDKHTIQKSWSQESEAVMVSDKRKEWVKWEASLESTYHFSCNCFDTFAVFQITGRASKKHLWWSAGFNDEVAWGEISVNACPPLIPIGVSTGKVYNVENVRAERMVWSGAKQTKLEFPNGINVYYAWEKAGRSFGQFYTFTTLTK